MPLIHVSAASRADIDDLSVERLQTVERCQSSRLLPALECTSRVGKDRQQRLHFNSAGFDRLTHYLFRYPAKFHPPVARTLVKQFTAPGDLVLDPFCGSGTILVEAATLGRHAIGTDIDPVAVFVSNVKTHRYNIGHLRTTSERLISELAELERDADEYKQRQFEDISEDEMWARLEAESLWVPPIPNLLHWFRKYAVVDLARILRVIDIANLPHTHLRFFRLCFASIIRGASNADPVPVSGLEFTSHMRKKDEEGRIINPFRLFRRAVDGGIDALASYRAQTTSEVRVKARQVDVLGLSGSLHAYRPDAVITSPPYHNAVNYYRRHQLEMFWLGMTKTQRDRTAMKHDYIGRPGVRVSDPFLGDDIKLLPQSAYWYHRMEAKAPKRASAFKHYTVAMQKAARQIAQVLDRGALAVFVVGHSTWDEQELPTTDLFLELMKDDFAVQDIFWYPLKNRYMSYQRHNGASIDKEYVLVLRRT